MIRFYNSSSSEEETDSDNSFSSDNSSTMDSKFSHLTESNNSKSGYKKIKDKPKKISNLNIKPKQQK
ncbi:hypothetical protein Yalta_173 [Yalta virus]|nr:hypothetical protein Yalta_173 [Yalta virus]